MNDNIKEDLEAPIVRYQTDSIADLEKALKQLSLKENFTATQHLKLIKVSAIVQQTKSLETKLNEISTALTQQVENGKKSIQLKEEIFLFNSLKEIEEFIMSYSMWILVLCWVFFVLQTLPAEAYELCKQSAIQITNFFVKTSTKNQSGIFSSVLQLADSAVSSVTYALVFCFVVLGGIFLLASLLSGKSAIAIVVILSFFVLQFTETTKLAIGFYSLIRLLFFISVQNFLISITFLFIQALHSRGYSTAEKVVLHSSKVILLLTSFVLGIINSISWKANFYSFEHQYIIYYIQLITDNFTEF